MTIGSSGTATATMSSDAVGYTVESDVDESASSVTNTIISTSTADGESPQQQCVIESQGGGELGQATIGPAQSVSITSSVSGADSTFGIEGH